MSAWSHEYDLRKQAWERDRRAEAETGSKEPDWVEDARELLLRAAEGGMFNDLVWEDGQRSPVVAARASELIDRPLTCADVKAFGILDRKRDGWARRFWKSIEASWQAREREEAR